MTFNKQHYDVIIVGTGPGGATLAKELTEKKKKVLVLEWGNNNSIKGNKFQMHSMLGFPGKSLLLTNGMLTVARGITTGGSSVFYCATAFDPPYEMLKTHGIDIKGEVDEIKKEVPTAPLIDDLMGPMSQRIMDSAIDLGYDWKKFPKFIFQDLCKANCWRCFYGCPYQAKWNGRMYVEEAIDNGATHIINAKVKKVILNHKKAVGVEFYLNGSLKNAFADKIVLAAGGIGSPVILRESGIKQAGYNFFYDPLVSVMGVVKDINGGKEIPMSAGIHFEDEGYLMSDLTSPQYVRMAMTASGFKFSKMFSHSGTLQIMIKAKDELGGRLTDSGGVRKSLQKSDKQKLEHGTARAKKILQKAGAKDIFKSGYSAAHPGGTAKIGEITDSNLKTEFDNLYVCDCSVLPEAWGLPPTLTIIGMAKRLAKHIS